MTTFYHTKGDFPADQMKNFVKMFDNFEKTMESVFEKFSHSTELEILPDKKEYMTGDMITGNVVMIVYEQMAGKTLYLDFKGIEEASLFIVAQPETKYSRPQYSRDRSIVNRRFELLTGLKSFPPGTHTFPFKFKLDASLPTSVSFCESLNYKKISGSIRYTLNAVLVRPGVHDLDISTSRTIPIHRPLDFPIQPIQTLKDANITRFCCIDMGRMSCSALLDKNVYRPGEVANLTLSIDNLASDVDLNDISFKLIHSCVAIPYHNYKRVSRKVKCENRAPRVPKNQFAKIHLLLVLPEDLLPSTTGELVKSKYQFEIEIGVPYSPNVVLTLPIKIIKY